MNTVHRLSITQASEEYDEALSQRYKRLDEGVNNSGIYLGNNVVFKVLEKTEAYKADVNFYINLPACLAPLYPGLVSVSENSQYYFVEMRRQKGRSLFERTQPMPYEDKKMVIERVYHQTHTHLLEVLEQGGLILDLNSGNIFVDDAFELTGFVDANRMYSFVVSDGQGGYHTEALNQVFFTESFSVLAALSPDEAKWLGDVLALKPETFTLPQNEAQKLDTLLIRTLNNAVDMWRHIALWIDSLKGEMVEASFLDQLTDNKAFMQAAFPLAKEMIRWMSPYTSISDNTP